jgi:hypothetical protein
MGLWEQIDMGEGGDDAEKPGSHHGNQIPSLTGPMLRQKKQK